MEMKMEVFTKRKLFNLLTELKSYPIRVSLYLKSDFFSEKIEKLSLPEDILERIKPIWFDETILAKAKDYQTGTVIFWTPPGKKQIILPPFPIKENKISDGFDPSGLYQGFEEKFSRGVILVRWGEYSIGVFTGNELLAVKTGTGYIQKAHKKGGRSQARFARRTQEQKQDFLRKVGNRIEEKFKLYQLDSIFFGGNRLILNQLLKESSFLKSNSNKISKRILEAREAGRGTLQNILEEIEKSIVFTC